MGAGLAGSTVKLYGGGVNVNQVQFGDKLQGLPPVTGSRRPYKVYKTKAGGNRINRSKIYCINQLGGIGMGNKNSQFAPNADGVGWCPKSWPPKPPAPFVFPYPSLPGNSIRIFPEGTRQTYSLTTTVPGTVTLWAPTTSGGSGFTFDGGNSAIYGFSLSKNGRAGPEYTDVVDQSTLIDSIVNSGFNFIRIQSTNENYPAYVILSLDNVSKNAGGGNPLGITTDWFGRQSPFVGVPPPPIWVEGSGEFRWTSQPANCDPDGTCGRNGNPPCKTCGDVLIYGYS